MRLLRQITRLLAIGCVLLGGWSVNSSAEVQIEEKKIVPRKGVVNYQVSPDSSRLALILERGSQKVVLLEGQESARYDDLTHPIFSSDSQHLAYIAEREGKQLVVVDGREETAYDEINNLQFSPDSQQLAYVAHRQTQQLVVAKGQEKIEPQKIKYGTLRLNYDGSRLAYVKQKGEQWCLLVDDQEGPAYETISNVSFSPNGQRLVYAAQKNGKWRVVVDGQEGPEYDNLYIAPLFSPDSKRLAYVAEKEQKFQLVVDDQEGATYGTMQEFLCFSPNSQRLAYIVQDQGQWQVMVDGQPVGQKFSEIKSKVFFSPNSKHVAYIGRMKAYQAVLDGQVGAGYASINPLLIFSPDNRLAYGAWHDRYERLMVVNNQEIPPEYESIGRPVFNEDGKRLTYVAKPSRTTAVVVVEAQASPRYDYVLIGSHPYFTPDGSVNYFAGKNGWIWQVTQRVN